MDPLGHITYRTCDLPGSAPGAGHRATKQTCPQGAFIPIEPAGEKQGKAQITKISGRGSMGGRFCQASLLGRWDFGPTYSQSHLVGSSWVSGAGHVTHSRNAHPIILESLLPFPDIA